MSKQKFLVAGLTLTMAGFIGIANSEYFTENAIIPVKGDRPTVGFGSTYYEDGSPVRMGDKVTPVRALRIAAVHISKEENIFRNSIPGVKLSHEEYDVYVDWLYQYGTGNWSTSSMRKQLLLGNYVMACQSLLAFRKVNGYDCSTLVNGKPNKICYGVWTRQKERYAACMGAQ